MKEKIAVIIPAYNEEGRVGEVVKAVRSSIAGKCVIVVDDGSTDKTSEEAERSGAKVIILPENSGKAAAIYRGVKEVDAEIYLFLDADLIGLKPSHIEAMLKPLKDDSQIGMVLGRFRKGRFATNFSQFVTPNITGQRAVRKELIEILPPLDSYGFAVELFLNDFCRKNGYRLVYVDLVGVSQYMKEEKIGILKGFLFRLAMYRDIISYLIKKAFGKIKFSK
jgi:glycosyltransferase involved in cell wall biosynthesis